MQRNGIPYCGARRTNGQGTCTRPAGWATPHPGIGACKWHAGCTPAGILAAQREGARQLVARLGHPVAADPADALLGLLEEAAGNVAALREAVGALGLPGMVTEQVTTPGVTHTYPFGLDEHPLVRLYGQERDRLAKLASECLRLGIAERHVRAVEARGGAREARAEGECAPSG